MNQHSWNRDRSRSALVAQLDRGRRGDATNRKVRSSNPLGRAIPHFSFSRGIIQNASFHVGAPYLLNVDIKDFFPSIHTDEVIKIFRGLGFSIEMSRVLSMLCTYKGSLPQGAPTSPYLANLAFQRIDTELMKMCGQLRLNYSRYADDLTFSGRHPIGQEVVSRIERLLRLHNFMLNQKKIRMAKPGQVKYVTGLVVNERVHPDRRRRRELRAMFHRASNHPREFRRKSAQLTGWASYVHSYDVALGSKYLKIAHKIAAK